MAKSIPLLCLQLQGSQHRRFCDKFVIFHINYFNFVFTIMMGQGLCIIILAKSGDTSKLANPPHCVCSVCIAMSICNMQLSMHHLYHHGNISVQKLPQMYTLHMYSKNGRNLGLTEKMWTKL